MFIIEYMSILETDDALLVIDENYLKGGLGGWMC